MHNRTLANTLENAANHIAVHGWWRPDFADNNKDTHAACIANSIRYVTEDRDLQQLAFDALLAHFELNTLEELYALNDRQHFNIGKEWAIEHLREVADNFRQMQRQSVAAA